MFQVLFYFCMISCRILCKNTFNLFVYLLKKNTRIKVKSFECPKVYKKSKKIILGTSDAWWTICLSNRPSDPAWIYLKLTDFMTHHCSLHQSILTSQGPIHEILTKRILRIGDFEKLSFSESAILDFFSKDILFCFILMKISQIYLAIKGGSKFWWLLWFPAKNHSTQTF